MFLSIKNCIKKNFGKKSSKKFSGKTYHQKSTKILFFFILSTNFKIVKKNSLQKILMEKKFIENTYSNKIFKKSTKISLENFSSSKIA